MKIVKIVKKRMYINVKSLFKKKSKKKRQVHAPEKFLCNIMLFYPNQKNFNFTKFFFKFSTKNSNIEKLHAN